VSLVVAATAGVLFLAGLGLIIWALYLYLAPFLNPPTTALASGLISLSIAGGLLWGIARLNR
jgi:hypothetical protein